MSFHFLLDNKWLNFSFRITQRTEWYQLMLADVCSRKEHKWKLAVWSFSLNCKGLKAIVPDYMSVPVHVYAPLRVKRCERVCMIVCLCVKGVNRGFKQQACIESRASLTLTTSLSMLVADRDDGKWNQPWLIPPATFSADFSRQHL